MSYVAIDIQPDADPRDEPRYEEVTIPVYCLCRMSASTAEELLTGFAEPDYVEPSGMKFKLIPWEKENDGTEVDMLRIAKKMGRGLLVFIDRDSISDRCARMTDYAIWDDGWGEDAEEDVPGMKGEGLKWGRLTFESVLNAWTNVEVGSGALEDYIAGDPRTARWALLEGGKSK
jgi:hypothetical protein